MLDQLSLTNFKAFSEAEVPLAPYTLLSGLNSSGKSTVMQALALLRQSAHILEGDDVAGFLLNGDLVELGTGQDVLCEYYKSTTASAPAWIGLALRTGEDRYSWSVGYEREADLLRLTKRSTPPTATVPAEVSGSGFQYLRADRISPAFTYPRSHEQAIRRAFLGSRGEHTANYLRHFQDELVHERLHHPRATSRRLADEAQAWMQDICPDVSLEAEAIDGTDLVRLSYRFGTAGLSSSNRYRPTNVGFGVTYVLPVVVACLTARSGALLLLENPEAHLHPRGQTAMAMLTCAATAAGAQLIVETHSDHVLNGVRLAVKRNLITADQTMLHFFRRVHDRKAGTYLAEIVTPTLRSDGMLSVWPEGFFDEWESSLDQLLDE